MTILRTKLSRAIFLAGILVTFITIHFTNVLSEGGVEFSHLFESFGEHPWDILIYLAILFVPAFIASVVIPWAIRWVKSGT